MNLFTGQHYRERADELTQQGEFESAIDFYQRAIAIYREEDNQPLLSDCLHHMGICYVSLENTAAADHCFGEVARLFTYQQTEERLQRSQTIKFQGDSYAQLGDITRAIDCYHLALQESTQLTHQLWDKLEQNGSVSDSDDFIDQYNYMSSLLQIGLYTFTIYTMSGDGDMHYTIHCFQKAQSICTKLNLDNRQLVEIYVCIAECYAHIKCSPEAIHYFSLAQEIYENNNEQESVAYMKQKIATHYVDMNQFHQAINCLNEALEQLGPINKTIDVKSEYDLGCSYTAINNYSRAIKWLQTCASHCHQHNMMMESAECKYEEAKCHLALHDNASSEICLAQAAQYFNHAFNQLQQSANMQHRDIEYKKIEGDCYQKLSQFSQAADCYQQAAQYYRCDDDIIFIIICENYKWFCQKMIEDSSSGVMSITSSLYETFITICQDGNVKQYDEMINQLNDQQVMLLIMMEDFYGFFVAAKNGHAVLVKDMLHRSRVWVKRCQGDDAQSQECIDSLLYVPIVFSRDFAALLAAIENGYDIMVSEILNNACATEILDALSARIWRRNDLVKKVWCSMLQPIISIIFYGTCSSSLQSVKLLLKLIDYPLCHDAKPQPMPVAHDKKLANFRPLTIDYAKLLLSHQNDTLHLEIDSPLMAACRSGHKDIVKYLLQIVIPSIREELIEQVVNHCLIILAKHGDVETLQVMLGWLNPQEKRYCLTYDEYNTFVYAADNGNSSTLQCIWSHLSEKDRIAALSASQFAAYRLAKRANHVNVVEQLEEFSLSLPATNVIYNRMVSRACFGLEKKQFFYRK